MGNRTIDRLPIDKQTAQSLITTLRHAGMRHETHVRLGKQADLHLMETQQDLVCELLSFKENGGENFRLSLRTAKPKA